MAQLKEGDRVRIARREQTEEDIKSNLYFGHYADLTGTIQKLYDTDEVSIEIEPESLTKEIRQRHEDVRGQMKTRWLDGLSEEGRSRLTEREKNFNLRYVILVNKKDVNPAGPKPQPASAEAPARPTSEDLDAAEEAELRRRAGTAG
jgi:hypothetical protein